MNQGNALFSTGILLLTLFGVGLNPLWSAPAAVKTGFAERDISPEIGMERPGGYGKGFHQVFHDPCKVRAVVFDGGSDVVEPQVAEARRRIFEKTGIKPEAVLIGASHSHSSGPTGMVLPGEYDHADALVKELAYEESSAADPKYLEMVINGITEAVSEAFSKRKELRLGFGRGNEDSVSFNEPAGPIDPEVGVIGAWDEEGKLLGCVVNFACHATTSPVGISANYPWALEKVVRGSLGPDTVVVFLNGASGDVTQVDNASADGRKPGEDAALLLGGRVGAEAVKVLDRGSETDGLDLGKGNRHAPGTHRPNAGGGCRGAGHSGGTSRVCHEPGGILLRIRSSAKKGQSVYLYLARQSRERLCGLCPDTGGIRRARWWL